MLYALYIYSLLIAKQEKKFKLVAFVFQHSFHLLTDLAQLNSLVGEMANVGCQWPPSCDSSATGALNT